MTDKYAVIGNPIAHSKSPQIHKMFAEQTGQDISYEAILAPLDGFAAKIDELRKAGYKGCNVTVPFKFEAFKLFEVSKDHLSLHANIAQAVNTLVFDKKSIYGDNTDGAGLVRDIELNLGFDLPGKSILLLGAGGAAYGVMYPLLLAGARISLFNRTTDKAIALRNQMQSLPDHNFEISIFKLDISSGQISLDKGSYATSCDQIITFDCVINATSAGLSEEMPGIPETLSLYGSRAYDMMYGRETPFMKFAREHGAAVVADGLGMLVEQAAEAFYIWRGVRPETAPVIAALRAQQ